uniref:Uncharacterized protein n=1 Tax=Kuenenia stuttgartiensis TaxID=174633 RepID=Q1Q0L5_KUEST|nr:unknown protein [Candidatus Kuenenia stuttgartiensis]
MGKNAFVKFIANASPLHYTANIIIIGIYQRTKGEYSRTKVLRKKKNVYSTCCIHAAFSLQYNKG